MKPQIKVLLIEDNPAEATLIQLQLAHAAQHHYQFVPVERISTALQAIGVESFDVILLDLNLPDSNGLSGLARILEAAKDTPVIMLTSDANEQIAAEAVRAGAQDYLYKRNLDTPLLERAIRYAIERLSAQQALIISEQRYALALAGVNDGVWDWDITRGEVYFSPRLSQILGFTAREMKVSQDFRVERLHPDDADNFVETFKAHMNGASPYFEIECRVLNREGGYLWVLCRGLLIRDANDKPVRMAGSMSDISQRKAVEQQLIHEALHDGLTGLPNRSLVLDRVQQAMAVAQRRQGQDFAILFIDLNRFKSINDSLGHSVGNQFLQAVAQRLLKDVRPTDTLARLGGDEFALLVLEYADINTVFQLADRLHRQMEEKFVIGDAELYSGASIGIATYSDKYHSPEEILRDADIAMYRAKRSGRAYEVFDAEMRDLAMRRLKLETELRNAIEHNEFVVFYQPILSTLTGRVVGFEALVRWNHPRAGLVYPQTFIKLAEFTGLVVPLCWWVLEQACKDFSLLHSTIPEMRGISVGVNISGKIFNTGDAAEKLAAIVNHTAINPVLLHLEITEHAVMDHQYRALSELEKLRQLGIGLHIDDFGTGFSSLSHLQKFSYDTLKIDSSFVKAMVDSPDNEAIVKSIIAMGHLLGMDIVAEGVETVEQLQWLMKMGCPLVQGFLFSEAVPAAGIAGLVRNCRIESVNS